MMCHSGCVLQLLFVWLYSVLARGAAGFVYVATYTAALRMHHAFYMPVTYFVALPESFLQLST